MGSCWAFLQHKSFPRLADTKTIAGAKSWRQHTEPHPLGANTTILRLQATAVTAGLYFDLNTATHHTPLAAGGLPGNPAAQIPWTGPPVRSDALPAMHGYCPDRPHHSNASVPAVAHPCSSHLNPVPRDPFNIPYYSDRLECALTLPFHNNMHDMCRYCFDNIAAQPWYTQIEQDVNTLPPPLPQAPNAQQLATWARFLTHLCHNCEIMEQRILNDRRNDPAARANPPVEAAKVVGHTDQWPETTCTCLAMLCLPDGDERLCIRHRHRISTNKHYELLIMRAQNDQWLRGIGRKTTAGLLEFVSTQKKNGRAQRGVYRACRCGVEITVNPAKAPEVFLCLGCEGVVHVGDMARGNPLPAEYVPSVRTRQSTNQDYRLRRPLRRV